MELFDCSGFTAASGMRERVKTDKKRGIAIREAIEALPPMPDNYHVVTRNDQLHEIAALIEQTGAFVFDVETSDLHPWKSKIYSCGIRTGGQCFAIPFEHVLQPTINPRAFSAALAPYFADPDVKRMNHNLQFDCHFIEEQFGIPVGPLFCCTQLQAWIVDSSTDHGLKELCALYGIDEGGKNYSKQFGKTAWSHLPTELANYYLCKDVDLVPQLFQIQNQALNAKPRLKSLFWDVEMPVLNIVYEMERRGMRIDEDYFLNDLTPKIYEEYARCVNALRPFIQPYLHTLKKPMTVPEVLESPQALNRVFFDGLGVPLVKFATLKQDTNKMSPTYKQWVKQSLDKDAIAFFKHEREDMRLLGEFRKVNTVRKLIIDKLPTLWVKTPEGVFVHPSVNVTGAESGRMSMSSPNPQQIPSRMGAVVRNAFIPSPGNTLLSYDFGQQEMRFMAHFSKDKGLHDIFTQSKLDMYSQMAIDVFGLSPSEFADKVKAKKHPQRDKTKITVLGTGYGMMAGKLGRSLGVPKNEAQRILDKYFDAYPGIKDFQRKQEAEVASTGVSTTILGRERPIDTSIYGWERQADNNPIQGSAADQAKVACRNCERLFKENPDWPIVVWLLVHDEIIFEANKEWVLANKDAIRQIQQVMESSIPLNVPMVCNYVMEDKWGDEFDLDKYFDDLEEAA